MFVFYDTETTGRSKAFDQIVQFAAILTDDDLNPIEEINVRAKLLPWIIPSLGALRVTGMSASDLADLGLPSFYNTIKQVHDKLRSWSPAIFLGYNTISFDEPFLNQAFWQCLLPPYLTVMDGNSRMDVLPLARAASHFSPDALSVPHNEKGRAVFRLDQLAPHNGFSHENAHDALADVEATIFVAKLIRNGSPDLWNRAVANSSKSATSQKLSTSSPVLVFEHFGRPMPWWGQRLDHEGSRGRNGRLVDLGRDWSSMDALTDEQLLVRRQII